MPSWLAKAIVQKALSGVPGGRRLNHALQTHVTHSLDLDVARPPHSSRFAYKLAQCRRHVDNYLAHGGSAAAFTALELGTGWHPIVPIGLYVCGARTVWTLDREPMLTLGSVREVIQRFVVAAEQPDWTDILPHADARRVASLAPLLSASATTPHALLRRLDIHILTGDARETGLPDASIDVIVSNNTLEHIPAAELPAIFAELRRIARPTAIMSHYIDLADHYMYVDQHLSPYNFLRFSDRAWTILNNSLQYMNRLRVSDYRQLHAATGFSLLEEESDAPGHAALDRLSLAPRFRSYSTADLAVTATWMVSTPAMDDDFRSGG